MLHSLGVSQFDAAGSLANMTPITLCSLALCLWGYQTGAWLVAIPMALALEAHNFVKLRGTISWEAFQAIHVAGAILWVLAICYIPAYSPTLIPYAVTLHLLKCLPVGLFPFILAQLYTQNFLTLYHDRVFSQSTYRPRKIINFAYPYFGSCLLAASSTGGNTVLFLTAAAALTAGLLGLKRSRRFGAGAFSGLMALALIASIIGTNHLHLLAANFRLSPDFLKPLIEKVASLTPKQDRSEAKKVAQTDSAPNRDRSRKSLPLKISQAATSQTVAPQATAPQTGDPENSQPLQTAIQTAEGMAQSTNSLSPDNLPPTAQQSAQNALAAASANPSQENPLATQSTPAKGPSTSSSASAQSSPSSTDPVQSVQSGPSASSIGSAQPSSTTSSPNPLNRERSISYRNLEQQGGQQNNSSETSNLSNRAPIATAHADARRINAPESPEDHRLGSNNSILAQSKPTATENSELSVSAGHSAAAGAGGQADPQNSQTQIGRQGSLKLSDAILFRVAPTSHQTSTPIAPHFPVYIKEAAYNLYRSGTWQAVQPQFTTRTSSSGQPNWTVGTQTPNTSSVRISAVLREPEGILKLPIGTSRIEHLSVDKMQVNQYGTVSIEGKPGVLVYDVQFDPSHSQESPPTELDREVPIAEKSSIQNVLSSLDLKGKSSSQIVSAVESYFQAGFSYSLELPQSQKGLTPLTTFLLKRRAGHCEYFASATALLLRAAGIPTRYAVGYKVYEYSPSEQQYVVRASHTHAWVMAYIDGGWTKIDTTPAGSQAQEDPVPTIKSPRPKANRSLASPFNEASSKGQKEAPQTRFKEVAQKSAEGKAGLKSIGPLESFSKIVSHSGATLEKTVKTISQKLSQIISTLSTQLHRQTSSQLWGASVMALGATIILLSIFFAWRMATGRNPSLLRKRIRRERLDATVDGFDSEFYTIEQRLGQWGLERQPSETARQWMLRLQKKLPTAQIEGLDRILELHYRYRFDPQGIAAEDRAELKTLIQSWLLKSAA